MSPNESVIDLAQAEAITKKVKKDGSLKVLEHSLKPFSKDKVGFLGTHQNLQIKLSNGEVLKFFVKSVPQGSPEQAEFVKKRQVFNHEADFFNNVMPQLLEVTSAGDVEDWAPKCYFANDNVVVLEDLKALGYAMSEKKILESVALKSSVKTMARLHAASILAEKKLGKTMKELFPIACQEQLCNEYVKPLLIKIFENLILGIAKKNGRSDNNVHETAEKSFDFVNKGNDKLRVINHGDAWPNNIMLNSSSPPNCRLVDYQLTRYAPRMLDVAELIYTSTTVDIRKKDEKSTIETYWNELCETLRKCDPDVERPSFEEILNEYENARTAGLMIALIYYPTILLSQKIHDEYGDDPETLMRKFVFRQNNDCVFELMEKDEEYGNRITEAALEFVEISQRLAAH